MSNIFWIIVEWWLSKSENGKVFPFVGDWTREHEIINNIFDFYNIRKGISAVKAGFDQGLYLSLSNRSSLFFCPGNSCRTWYMALTRMRSRVERRSHYITSFSVGESSRRSLLPFNALHRLAIRDNAPQSVYLPRLLNFGTWRVRVLSP